MKLIYLDKKITTILVLKSNQYVIIIVWGLGIYHLLCGNYQLSLENNYRFEQIKTIVNFLYLFVSRKTILTTVSLVQLY